MNFSVYDYIETRVSGGESKLTAIQVDPPVATDLTELADPGATNRKRRFILQLASTAEPVLDFQNV